MAPARFSPFELLLLKSRHQPDTAALLLLAWVLVNKRTMLDEDKHYLEMMAHDSHHGQDLDLLLAIAASRSLEDIQLAAEVLLWARADEQPPPFLPRAIALATSDGALSLRNHHILRFLADLSGVAPDAFAQLFRKVTGSPLAAPADPSQYRCWQASTEWQQSAAAEAPHADDTWNKRSLWQRWHARQRRQEARRQEQTRQREQERQEQQRQERARQREQERQAQQRQERVRQREQERQEQQRQEQQRQRQQDTPGSPPPPPHYRTRLALRVLELDEYASRRDIKLAYRRLAQRHHPDRFHGQGDLRIALASQRFQRIKNAYDYLMQHA